MALEPCIQTGRAYKMPNGISQHSWNGDGRNKKCNLLMRLAGPTFSRTETQRQCCTTRRLGAAPTDSIHRCRYCMQPKRIVNLKSARAARQNQNRRHWQFAPRGPAPSNAARAPRARFSAPPGKTSLGTRFSPPSACRSWPGLLDARRVQPHPRAGVLPQLSDVGCKPHEGAFPAPARAATAEAVAAFSGVRLAQS